MKIQTRSWNKIEKTLVIRVHHHDTHSYQCKFSFDLIQFSSWVFIFLWDLFLFVLHHKSRICDHQRNQWVTWNNWLFFLFDFRSLSSLVRNTKRDWLNTWDGSVRTVALLEGSGWAGVNSYLLHCWSWFVRAYLQKINRNGNIKTKQTITTQAQIHIFTWFKTFDFYSTT